MGKLIDIDDIFGEKVIMVSQKAYDEVMKLMCMIREAPEVDAVPVVRCKDCKWWIEETEYEWDGETELTQLCIEHDAYFEPDDFCSYGERREDGKAD